ncbi:hypothetical protein JYU34_017299 [Plutella xylostella]|uniref:Uncharacterized protein n=1 Tax=Plutella xylostella TaxID=51655 RepID=A0ABQ7Q268_PLUXY|nr:hypothetical protein JYU34_017299 [Plutella xylostella]
MGNQFATIELYRGCSQDVIRQSLISQSDRPRAYYANSARRVSGHLATCGAAPGAPARPAVYTPHNYTRTPTSQEIALHSLLPTFSIPTLFGSGSDFNMHK